MFLLYYPLKQGLKLRAGAWKVSACFVFTLLSIKTRIETHCIESSDNIVALFLLYYPLKQGLKLIITIN